MSDNIKTFKHTIIDIYGTAGQKWLQSLPSITTHLTNKWQLKKMEPLSNLSYNYVLAGTQDSIPVILKLGFEATAIAQEAAALRVLQGPCVKVLEQDNTYNALLLEQVVPGTTLKEYFPERDQEGIIITSGLIKSFKSGHTAKELFIHVADMLNILDNDYPLLSNHLVKARELSTSLLSTTEQSILLHGDLHHENILRQDNTWRVIDPKGIIGDQAYECAAYIHNPFPDLLTQQNLHEIINKRIQIFAKLLDISEQRIAQWSYVKAVMAACWAIDDNIDPNNWIALSHILKDI